MLIILATIPSARMMNQPYFDQRKINLKTEHPKYYFDLIETIKRETDNSARILFEHGTLILEKDEIPSYLYGLILPELTDSSSAAPTNSEP